MPTYASLLELQKIDAEIDRAASRVEGFAPLLEELESHQRKLAARIERARTRLRELSVAERRLERTAEEKRNRLRMLRDRLLKVHNLRQEAAVRAEMDLLNRSVDGDEQEALTYLDQIRKLEEEADKLERELADERERAGPRRREIEQEREDAESALASLQIRREACAVGLDRHEREVYEGLRSSRKGAIVMAITADGACGRCFSMVPLQMQAEVRAGGSLRRCEACGIIFAPRDGE